MSFHFIGMAIVALVAIRLLMKGWTTSTKATGAAQEAQELRRALDEMERRVEALETLLTDTATPNPGKAQGADGDAR